MNKVGGIFAELSLRVGEFARGMRRAIALVHKASQDMEQALGTKPSTALDMVGKKATEVSTLMSNALGSRLQVVLKETGERIFSLNRRLEEVLAVSDAATKIISDYFTSRIKTALIETNTKLEALKENISHLGSRGREAGEKLGNFLVGKTLQEDLYQTKERVAELNRELEKVKLEDEDSVATFFDRMGDSARSLTEDLKFLVEQLREVRESLGGVTESSTGLEQFTSQMSNIRESFAQLQNDISGSAGQIKQAFSEVTSSGEQLKDSLGTKTRNAVKDTGSKVTKTTKNMQKDVKKTSNVAQKEAAKVTWVLRGYIKDTFRVWSGILISQVFYTTLRYIREMIGAAYELKMIFEEAALSFRYLLGVSDSAARQFSHRMRYWALDTEFSIGQMTQAFRELTIAGVGLRDIEPVMQIISGTATAYRMSLEELIGTLKQVQAATVVSSSELRRLSRAGIPIGEILMEQLDLTREELLEINKLQIPGEVMFRALVKGMERFTEAAVEGSKTVRALSSDFIEVSQDILGIAFAGPFERWRQLLERMLNWVVALREGLLEHRGPVFFLRMFSPEVRQSIEMIIASLRGLWDGLVRIGRVLKTVLGEGFRFVGRVLAQILPVIASLVRDLAALLERLTSGEGVIRKFTTALGTLMIAYTVGAAMKVLVSVIMKLPIIRSIAGMFVTFTHVLFATKTGVEALTVAKLKFAAAATFLAKRLYIVLAILTVLLGNLGRITNYIQSAGESISAMFGAFPDRRHYSDYIDGSDELAKAMLEIGDAAEEAGDQAADAFKPFLAAFDEVYQIPEQMSKADDSLRDWPIPEWPDMMIPSELPDWRDLVADSVGAVGDMFEDLHLGFEGFFDWFEDNWWKVLAGLVGLKALWPIIKKALIGLLWNVAGLLDKGIAGLWKAIKASSIVMFLKKWLWLPLKKWFVGFLLPKLKILGAVLGGTLLGPWGLAIVAALTAIALLIYHYWDDIVAYWHNTVAPALADGWDWVKDKWNDSLHGIGNVWEWIKEKWEAGIAWIVDTWNNLPEILEEAKERIIAFFLDDIPYAVGYAAGAVVRWKIGTEKAFRDWVKNTWKNIIQWKIDTEEAFRNWVRDTWKNMVQWKIDTEKAFREWVRDTWLAIIQWKIDTEKAFREWAKDAPENIRKGLIRAWIHIKKWIKDSWEAIKDWAKDTTEEVKKWFGELPGKIAEFMRNAVREIGSWFDRVKTAAGRIGKAIWDGIVGAILGLPGKIGEVFENVRDTIGRWVSPITKAVERVGKSASDGWDRGMDIYSPSYIERSMQEIAENTSDAAEFLQTAFDGLERPIRTVWHKIADGIVGVWSSVLAQVKNISLEIETVMENLDSRMDRFQYMKMPKLNGRGSFTTREALSRQESRGYDDREADREAFASYLKSLTRDMERTQDREPPLPPLYVGTLIADERGLKELWRKFKLIGVAENYRVGSEV